MNRQLIIKHLNALLKFDKRAELRCALNMLKPADTAEYQKTLNAEKLPRVKRKCDLLMLQALDSFGCVADIFTSGDIIDVIKRVAAENNQKILFHIVNLTLIWRYPAIL